VTVPHGLRSSYRREEARRALVAEAVATADLERYAAILASVDQADWFGFWSELVLRVGVPIVPERVLQRHAPPRARLPQSPPSRRDGVAWHADGRPLPRLPPASSTRPRGVRAGHLDADAGP
jgi:hypothetical protein